ncbi:GntR family transcriptional regulator [Shumkonia mesophila]|uniref:GntR family transcriptional regulator n=1 Tax=Shumkonia mesophila TaxID=2838854 RepID=UPI0029351675|nr:GntR family transcriptional regulator [Shumkonia mesophila]
MNPLGDFDVDRSRPVAEQVYAKLRSEIISLNLKPGHVLSESELASWLGVSRTPIRQAVKKLEEEGFVDSVPHLGTFVSQLRIEALIEAQFVRESLECALIKLAAKRINAASEVALRGILEQQEEAFASNDFLRFYALDQEFHKFVCSLAGMPGIWKTVEVVAAHLNRVRRLSLPLPSVPTEIVGQHWDIFNSLVERDPAGAERAMRKHLKNILKMLPNIQDENQQFFKNIGPS